MSENRVTAIPGNMPGAVRDREHLSREVPRGKPLPGSASREVPPTKGQKYNRTQMSWPGRPGQDV